MVNFKVRGVKISHNATVKPSTTMEDAWNVNYVGQNNVGNAREN
jgi:hypothetical protein